MSPLNVRVHLEVHLKKKNPKNTQTDNNNKDIFKKKEKKTRKKCAERESSDRGFQNARGSLMLLLEEIRQAEKQADAPQ